MGLGEGVGLGGGVSGPVGTGSLPVGLGSEPGYRPGGGGVRSGPVQVAAQASGQIDLGLELLDARALDTGAHRALVVIDPQDRRKVQGFVHLSAVGIGSALRVADETFATQADAEAIDQLFEPRMPDWRHGADVRGLVGLSAELEAQTGLRAVVDQDAALDGTDWMETPFVLLTSAVDFAPTDAEVKNLGRYLISGGFAYVEVVGYHNRNTSIDREIRDLHSLRDLVRKALPARGGTKARTGGSSRCRRPIRCSTATTTYPRCLPATGEWCVAPWVMVSRGV